MHDGRWHNCKRTLRTGPATNYSTFVDGQGQVPYLPSLLAGSEIVPFHCRTLEENMWLKIVVYCLIKCPTHCVGLVFNQTIVHK